MIKRILLLVLTVIVFSCGQGSKKVSEVDKYNDMLSHVRALERSMQTLSTASMEQLNAYSEAVDTLYYDYNPMELQPDQIDACESLKKRVAILKRDAGVMVQEAKLRFRYTAHSNPDCLLDRPTPSIWKEEMFSTTISACRIPGR